MRKIKTVSSINPVTFNNTMKLRIEYEDGSVDIKTFDIPPRFEKYKAFELLHLELINNFLTQIHKPILTDEEESSIINHQRKLTKDMNLSSDDLQRLAGFKVDRNITYYDDYKPDQE